MLISEKKCKQCNESRSFDHFHANKASKDGKVSICKDCTKDYQMKNREKHRKFQEARKKPQHIDKIVNSPEIPKGFYIPDIYLVGYGRTQSYQISCLKCKNPFFQINEEKTIQNLFCDCCKIDLSLVREERISPVYVIGVVIGWIVKTEGVAPKKTCKNYKKVYERDQYTCRYCGYNLQNFSKFLPLHIDHIQSWTSSENNKMENLVVSCSECSLITSDKWFFNFEDKRDYILYEKNRRN